MLKKIFSVFFIFLLLSIYNATGQVQYIDFETLNVDNGLISNETQVILQDYIGFMWFGTKSGLVRYDGYDFVPYQANPNDSSELQINGIEVLFEGQDSTLWVICGFPGQNFYLQSYNREKEKFDIVYGPFKQSWKTELNPPIIGEADGTIWLRTSSGLIKVPPTSHQDKNTRQYTYKRYSNQPLSDSIYSLFMDNSQKLWIGSASGLSYYDRELDSILYVQNLAIDGIITGINQISSGELVLASFEKGLFVWNPNTNELENYHKNSQVKNSISGERVIKMVKDKRGDIWMRTYDSKKNRHGLDRFDPVEQVFTNYSFFSDHPGKVKGNIQPLLGRETLFTDRQGEIWVFTWAGIERYNPDKDSFYQLKYISTDRQITWENFATFYEDRSGKYWISYVLGGMLTYAPSTKKIHAFHYIPGDSYSVSHGTVISLYEDLNDNIWVGSYGGIDKFTLDERHQVLDIKHFKYKPDDIFSLRPAPFYVFMSSHNDSLIWVKTGPNSLNQLDLTTEKFYHDQNSRHLLLNTKEPLSGMIEATDGRIWYGTLGAGLKVFEPIKNQTRTFLPNPNDSQSISSAFIIPFFLDEQEQLWCVSGKGLIAFNTRLETAKIFMEDVSFGRTQGLVQEDKRLIWIPSGGGLYKYDIRKNTYRIYSLNDSFPTFSVNSILEDNHKNLWLSSDQGIIHFNPETEKVQSYGLKDGLPTLQFAFGRTMKRKNGDLMFGTAGKGFVVFHPDSLKPNLHKPQIVLTDFLLSNQPIEPSVAGGILEKDISLTDYIELAYHQNTIGFKYAALHYAKSDQNQYSYMMEGVDDDWIDAKTRRFAGYAGLSPGLYTFKVRGTNADGVWNEEGKSIKIRIRYPWWQRWWAVLMYMLLLSWGIYAFLRWRTREQRQKIILQERELERERQHVTQLTKVDQLKDQFLANTSHELRTPLQGIIGISESMIDEINNEDHQENLSMIISSGRRLNNLVNDILDFSKLKNEDLQLNRKPLDLRAMIDIVLKNNTPLIRGKELKLINEISANLPSVYADENRLQQILFNLIGNAIKFTEKGYVKISANHRDDMVEIAIEDTGIGISKEQQALIFEEFKQADGSISREFQGTGLGLSITKYLIELHGGNIEVESEPEKGAAFLFTLPVSNEKATTLAISSSQYASTAPELIPSNSIHSSEDSVHILVVDDEPINQRVFKNHLSEKSFRITQALNGEEAIKIIEEHGAFDLVLLDIMMPRMSGYEVCQKIREQYLISELPVIMVTAKDQLQDIVQGLSLGANDYLPKPFSKEELLARINTQLDLHRIFDVAGRFVPNEFLHALDRQKITEVTLGDHTEREVTVLFTDIRDYTTLSEAMTPHENFKFVNAFHGRMGPIIQQHQGFVNQYLGDAIMAIFPDHPEHALYAAIDMQKILQVYNDERKIKGRKPLKMGIGLHTGPLIMGIIGDTRRMDAATISDTVNTASRIESLTKHYGASILLSQNSLENIPKTHTFHFRELGKVQVKGRKEPIGIIECFDGDTSSHIQMKQQTQEIFKKGLKQFFSRQFPDAASSFNQVLTLNPNDLVAKRFKQKSAKYMLDGVEEDWKGIDVMDTK